MLALVKTAGGSENNAETVVKGQHSPVRIEIQKVALRDQTLRANLFVTEAILAQPFRSGLRGGRPSSSRPRPT